MLREGELCSSPVLRTTVKKTLGLILAVVAYLGLYLFPREEVVVGTLVCFPISCLAFSEKKKRKKGNPEKHAALFAISGDIAIYS